MSFQKKNHEGILSNIFRAEFELGEIVNHWPTKHSFIKLEAITNAFQNQAEIQNSSKHVEGAWSASREMNLILNHGHVTEQEYAEHKSTKLLYTI